MARGDKKSRLSKHPRSGRVRVSGPSRRPYKVVGSRFRGQDGKLKTKSYAKRYPHLVRRERIYFSKTSQKITSKKKIRRSYRAQSLLELFPKIKRTGPLTKLLRDYREGDVHFQRFLKNRYPEFFKYLFKHNLLKEPQPVEQVAHVEQVSKEIQEIKRLQKENLRLKKKLRGRKNN